MIEVKLTTAELWQAGVVGLLRQIEAIQSGHRDKYGVDPANGWLIHVEGACGELAVAKALGHYSGLTASAFKAPDIGDLHVRTRSRDDYELIVRDTDPDDGLFVLVTGGNGRYRVVGAIKGRDAKRPEWRKDHGGRSAAYFVPHHALTWRYHPLEREQGAAR